MEVGDGVNSTGDDEKLFRCSRFFVPKFLIPSGIIIEFTVSVVDPAWQSVNIKRILKLEDNPGHTSFILMSHIHPLQLWIVGLHQVNHATWIWNVMVRQCRYLQHPILQKDQIETQCVVLSS